MLFTGTTRSTGGMGGHTWTSAGHCKMLAGYAQATQNPSFFSTLSTSIPACPWLETYSWMRYTLDLPQSQISTSLVKETRGRQPPLASGRDAGSGIALPASRPSPEKARPACKSKVRGDRPQAVLGKEICSVGTCRRGRAREPGSLTARSHVRGLESAVLWSSRRAIN